MSDKNNQSYTRLSYWLRQNEPVVGRAELKLLDAVKGFNFDFKDKTVLDIGSSTGGFTELALRMGAKKVIAVEKGTNQMKFPLRANPKVELHEKTDFFKINRSTIGDVDVVLADVSFVSLKKVLAYARFQIINEKADFLVMLKPQFEAAPQQLNRGIVKNETIRREIIKNFENWLRQKGFAIIKKQDNKIIGKYGNVERFYWLKLSNFGHC